MSQKIVFENHFSKRVVEILFPEGFSIRNKDDLSHLKEEWTKNLKSWHSPYTCIFDLRKFELSADMKEPFNRLIQFFSSFFMRKIIGFYEAESIAPEVNFSVIMGYDEAAKEAGLLKGAGLVRNLDDLRSRIQIDNDFNAHAMDIQFLAATEFTTKEHVLILKDKIKNILRQWHTPYSVLINCLNCTFEKEAYDEFIILEKFLKSFFCKQVIGYANKGEKETYPFKVFRSRHIAAAELENSGLQSGSVANCSTRKT